MAETWWIKPGLEENLKKLGPFTKWDTCPKCRQPREYVMNDLDNSFIEPACGNCGAL